jgi:hypothetical protein
MASSILPVLYGTEDDREESPGGTMTEGRSVPALGQFGHRVTRVRLSRRRDGSSRRIGRPGQQWPRLLIRQRGDDLMMLEAKTFKPA